MKHIYCISGFGADERVFSKLDFGNNDVHFLSWLMPVLQETIESYAKRMAENIVHQKPILVGLSFGGIMATEIAKIIPTEKIIIISSIKTCRAFPLWMRLSGKLKLNHLIPMRSFKLIEPLENYNLGIENKDELELVQSYRKKVSQVYTNWAIDQILNWKNDWIPENIIHIHGSKDHVFPIKNVQADYVIAGGGHFMIMNRSNELNKILSFLRN
jgi:pimeloyl-ACP methyl ester carboxylesterase